LKNSAEILKKANIVPDLHLAIKTKKGVQGTGTHQVKMISDRIIKGTDYQTGKERLEVEYLLEENGEKKKYSVPMKDKNGEVHYLVQRLAEVEEGEEIILEYKRQGLKGFIQIERIGSVSEPKEIKDLDIPVIEKEEDTNETDKDVFGDIDEKIPF